MKKLGIFPACLLCAATVTAVTIALTVTVNAGAAASPPPEPTELNWSRRPVLFSHRTHLNAAALRNRADVPEGSPKQPNGKEADSPPAADDQESSPKRPDGEETDNPPAAAVCVTCHHPVDGMTQHLTCATPDCHDNLNPKDKSVRSYYLAAHAAPKGRFYSCVACHTEQAGDDAPAMKRMAGCEESVCHKS